VPLVKALGARVVLEAPVELTTLFATLDGVDVLVARGEPLPPFDLHCPLLSLPLEFRTNLASIPAGAPYLRADPERVERWRARLGDSGRARIGLVWTGNPLHLNDRNRSMTLAELLPLLDDRYDWISVQKVIRDDDRAVLDASAIRFVGDDLTDFAETAALIGALDAVISVDTSVAHLAGALGCPLAVLLPHTPDFRWLLDRDDSRGIRARRCSGNRPAASGRRWSSACAPRCRRCLRARRDEHRAAPPLRAAVDDALRARAKLARDFAGAARLYEGVLAMLPDHVEALHLLGVVHLERGDPSRAEPQIARSMRFGLDQPWNFTNHAVALTGIGRHRDALDAAAQALARDPGHARAHAVRGDALLALGRHAEALGAYDLALMREPGASRPGCGAARRCACWAVLPTR
jgi:hypothetical protein